MIVIFVATLIWAPWVAETVTKGRWIPSLKGEYKTTPDTISTWSTTDPIWSGRSGASINMGTLAVEWVAIGVVYTALFFMLKDNKKPSNQIGN